MLPLPPKRLNKPNEYKSIREVSGSTRRARTCPPEIRSRDVDATGCQKCIILLELSRPQGRRPWL